MVTPVSPPDIFSPVVSAVAVTFDADGPSEPFADSQRIPLPEALARAVDKRKREFLAGRWCAREALRRLGLRETGDVAIGPDRGPVWPDGVTGAITHSHGYACAAVARDRDLLGLGIDSESVRAIKSVREIHDMVLSPGERDRVLAGLASRVGEDTAVIAAFSAKESLYKCLAPAGHSRLGFGDVELTELDIDGRRFAIRLARTMGSLTPAHVFRGRWAVSSGFVHTAVEWPRP